VRAFVQICELLASNKDLAQRLDQLEAGIEKRLTSHDDAIAAMLSAIHQLMRPPQTRGLRRPSNEAMPTTIRDRTGSEGYSLH
jgi:hypothetical protein